jgi:hypothetical protein
MLNFIFHSKGRTILRIFEKRVLRKILASNSEVVTIWGKLSNGEFHILHSPQNTINITTEGG